MRIGRSAVLFTLSMLLLFTPALSQENASEGGKKKITMRESLLFPAWGSYELSPDNTKIVFTKREMDEEEWESVTHIWVHDLESGESFQLTNSARGAKRP